jgi:hypothetical protein
VKLSFIEDTLSKIECSSNNDVECQNESSLDILQQEE